MTDRMPVLEQINPKNVSAFRMLRLWALQDSPSAFGSTYARESQFPEAEWLQRAANMNGETRVGYLAMDNASPYGIIGAFRDEHDPAKAQVISMWVAPAYRRTGVGRALIAAIEAWAQKTGARRLQLLVTSGNHSAMEFYKQCGFAFTGRTEPYPNDPSLIEYEMARAVLPDD